ncbi:MAG: helix-turn-helix domain-containing protein [Colwellia sp.]|nr:helix-turn-helix domain-containing protein [Colwellia sp.]MCW8863638.1 helix-turn-helix domain-containing protein [Colwellia sp.]MCW9080394.1 helix-turn-helix domain-containing protein [Colwellia sp.]
MTFIDILYGIGIFQGASLLFALLSLKGSKHYTNLIMATMIFALMLILGHNWLIRLDYFLTSPTLALAHLPLDYLIGPLLYFYGLSLTQEKFSKIQLLHFLPAAIAVIPAILFATISFTEQTDILKYIWYKELSITEIDTTHLFLPAIWDLWMKNALQGTFHMLHVGIYCMLLFFVIKRNRVKLKSHYSSLEEKDLNWLRNLTMALMCYLAIFLIFNRIPILITTPSDPVNFYPHLTIVVIIQIIAWVSLRQPNIIHGKKSREENEQPTATAVTEPANKPVGTESLPLDDKGTGQECDLEKEKYKRSGLSLEDAQEYRIHVMNIMKEKQLYLECELTLSDLAEQADIPQHQLSEVLNGQLNQNFYSFVNDYRVQYAKELLTGEKTKNMPIVELAFEAGFRSKSSFYDAFKKATAMTPTQYKKKNP